MIERRGVVILLREFSDRWLQWMEKADLNLLGLHTFDKNELIKFINSEKGKKLFSEAKNLDIDIEFEVHALSWLLPKDKFKTTPTFFRENYKKFRTPDHNCCVSNENALELIQKNAKKLSEIIIPTTNRYYFWQDDGKDVFCHCDECRHLSASDQALILMNTIIDGIKEINSDAKLSFLAYLSTLDTPKLIKPRKDIFLEFAPIRRKFHCAINDNRSLRNYKQVQKLKSLISYFGITNAQILEYWLDCSLFSGWRENVRKKIPFQEEILQADVNFYKSLGFKSMTSFAVFLDDLYIKKYGFPPITRYGEILKS
ncbi:MAG: DUF4838 domain-containing protein [Promethearchaeota archaeon]